MSISSRLRHSLRLVSFFHDHIPIKKLCYELFRILDTLFSLLQKYLQTFYKTTKLFAQFSTKLFAQFWQKIFAQFLTKIFAQFLTKIFAQFFDKNICTIFDKSICKIFDKSICTIFEKQAYMAYKSRLNIKLKIID